MFHFNTAKRILLGISIAISIALLGGYISARNERTLSEIQALSVSSFSDNPYDPAQYGVPDTLGGYKVLAVVTSHDLACTPPHVKRVLLIAQQKTAKEYLQQSMPLTDILSYLRQLPGEGDTDWELAIGGPNTAIENLKAGYASWNKLFADRPCARLGGPVKAGEPYLVLPGQ